MVRLDACCTTYTKIHTHKRTHTHAHAFPLTATDASRYAFSVWFHSVTAAGHHLLICLCACVCVCVCVWTMVLSYQTRYAILSTCVYVHDECVRANQSWVSVQPGLRGVCSSLQRGTVNTAQLPLTPSMRALRRNRPRWTRVMFVVKYGTHQVPLLL